MRLTRILQAVVDDGEIKETDLIRHRVTRAHNRHYEAVIYLMHELTPASWSEIGTLMDRDHSSIRSVYNRAERRKTSDHRFELHLKKLSAMLKSEDLSEPADEHERLVFVGESPGATGHPGLPLHPTPSHSTGGRLAVLIGLSASEYLQSTRRVNLIPFRVGEHWPEPKAMAAAENLAAILEGHRLILIGRRVADAFKVSLPPFTWHSSVNAKVIHAVIPHPSGLNTWYMEPENERTARKFLRHAMFGKNK